MAVIKLASQLYSAEYCQANLLTVVSSLMTNEPLSAKSLRGCGGPGQNLLKAPPDINNILCDHKYFMAFLALGGGAFDLGAWVKVPPYTTPPISNHGCLNYAQLVKTFA
jgi:hypothetical protein